MSPRALFSLGLAMLAVALVNAGDCPCGSGVDVCGCTPTVVRPQHIPKPCPSPRVFCARVDPPRYEGTDYCRCKQQHVPAAPKPPYRCITCQGSYSPPRPSENHPVATIPFTQDDFDAGYVHDFDENEPTAPGVNCGQKQIGAADPVSLHIAFANRPAQPVKEGGLSYGFYKTPEYQPITKKYAEINEEGLNVMRKNILELRVPTGTQFVEELPVEDDMEYLPKETNGLSYAQLGYMPVKRKSCSVTKLPEPCNMQEPMVYVGQPSCPPPHSHPYPPPSHPYPTPRISYVEQSEEAHSGESEVMGDCGGCGTCSSCLSGSRY